MKIYISGAITNNPNYKEQFKRAEERLKAEGHTVINPAENQGSTYKEYIDIGLFELMHCDAIYLLRGYERSTGATLEHDYARTVGLKVIREEDELTVIHLNGLSFEEAERALEQIRATIKEALNGNGAQGQS